MDSIRGGARDDGGARRNRLFMAASLSLYSVYVGSQGAHVS